MKTTAYQTWHKKALEETRVRPKVRVALMDACERLHVDAVRQPTGETVCTWWDLLCGGPERYEKDWLALGAAATYIRFLYAMGHLGIFTVPINAYPLADSEPRKCSAFFVVRCPMIGLYPFTVSMAAMPTTTDGYLTRQCQTRRGSRSVGVECR
mgnify:CR=1 FL=1